MDSSSTEKELVPTRDRYDVISQDDVVASASTTSHEDEAAAAAADPSLISPTKAYQLFESKLFPKFFKIKDTAKEVLFNDDEEAIDKEASNSTSEYVLYAIRDFFLDNIPYPIVNEFGIKKRYIIGTLSYVAYWALFGYFFYVTYIDQTQDSPYISTTYDKLNCDKVPVKVTSSFYLDYEGLWEGETNFAYYASPFRFQFTKFSVDTAVKYTNMLTAYRDSIDTIGDFAESQPLAINLVLWMSYIRYYYLPDPTNVSYSLIGSDNLQYVEFTGDPSVVFKSPYNQGFISSYKGVCNSTDLVTVYSQGDASLRAEVNEAGYEAMESDPICSAASSTNIFSKSWGYHDKVHRFDLDVRSFSTAMAVNLGIIELTSLGWSKRSMFSATINGSSYQMNEYFDTRYRTMTPIVCMREALTLPHYNYATNVTTDDLCFLRHGETFFLPIFNHIGKSLESPTPCTCDDNDDDDNVSSDDSVCNSFYLIPSLLFYKVPEAATRRYSASTQIGILLGLRARYKSYIDFNTAGYNASASAALNYLVGNDKNISKMMDEAWFTGAHDFCAIDNGENGTEYCSMVTFASLNNEDRRISLYQYELVKGHCFNSFSVSQGAWTHASDPPVDIYENYYVCTQDEYNAVINAIGLATGNIAIFFMAVLALTLPVVYLVLACMYKPKVPPEYPPEKITLFLENLATVMLRYSTPRSAAGSDDTDLEKKNSSNLAATKNSNTVVDPQEIQTIVSVVKELEKFLEKVPEVENEKASTCEKISARFFGITESASSSNDSSNGPTSAGASHDNAPRLALERVNTLTRFAK